MAQLCCDVSTLHFLLKKTLKFIEPQPNLIKKGKPYDLPFCNFAYRLSVISDLHYDIIEELKIFWVIF
jgi:hypothetical protein